MIRSVLGLLLLLVAAACGQSERKAVAIVGTPALWTVENVDGEAAGWLFGTIHALPDGSAWETPALADAVARAGVLVVEVRDLDAERVKRTLMRLARDEPGPPLVERLPPDERGALRKLFARSGTPAAAYDSLETWAAALALSRLADTAPIANGADQAMIARFANRPIAELEGAETQLAIFDALPERDQRALLSAVLDEQQDTAVGARSLAEAWLAGDLDALDKATRRGVLAEPALYKALLADRNRAWLAKLRPMFKDSQRPFVAVGTAHMLGPDGLPALLAAEGYRIRRIQ